MEIMSQSLVKKMVGYLSVFSVYVQENVPRGKMLKNESE